MYNRNIILKYDSIFKFSEENRTVHLIQGEEGVHMKSRNHRRLLSFLKILPLLVCISLIVCLLSSGKELTVQTVLNFSPENPVLAAIALLLLYAFKSISFVFPVVILQIAAGHLFEAPAALLINFIGRAVTLTIPYWIGRFSGGDMAQKQLNRYPKLKEIVSKQNQSPFFISFFLRTLNFLPGDVVSLYLGAVRIPFPYYLAASVLGTAPGIIFATLLGATIEEPDSPAFLLSISCMGLLAASSFLLHLHNQRKGKINH